MDKCLVTKLGASVSGDFPKLGELIIGIDTTNLNPTSDDKFKFTGSDCELRGGITFAGGGTGTPAVNLASDTYGYLTANESGQLVIKNKYAITGVNIAGRKDVFNLAELIDLKEFCYNSELTSLSISGVSSSGIVYPRLKGDIACLEGKVFTTLRLDGNPSLEGKIKALAKTMQETVKKQTPISNCSVARNTHIDGSIEELVVAIRALQVAAGEEPTSNGKTPSLNIGGSGVTFNGNTYAIGTGFTLSWTETTITFKGETITDVTE